jgi:hypothetical protein
VITFGRNITTVGRFECNLFIYLLLHRTLLLSLIYRSAGWHLVLPRAPQSYRTATSRNSKNFSTKFSHTRTQVGSEGIFLGDLTLLMTNPHCSGVMNLGLGQYKHTLCIAPHSYHKPPQPPVILRILAQNSHPQGHRSGLGVLLFLGKVLRCHELRFGSVQKWAHTSVPVQKWAHTHVRIPSLLKQFFTILDLSQLTGTRRNA